MKDGILEQSVAQKVLKSVLDHYGLTISDLMAKLNISGTTMLYDISRGKVKNSSRKFVDLLKGLYPELNEIYLRTGRGDMFVKPQEDTPKEEQPAIDMQAVLLHLVSVIANQTQAINEMRKEIEMMKLYVASLQQASRSYYFDNNEQGRKASDDSNKENK